VYHPATQLLHPVAPVLAWYLPAAHSEQADAAIAENLPATQLPQAEAALLPVLPVYLPAAQEMHTEVLVYAW